MRTMKLSDRDSFEENIIKEKSETVDSIGRFLLMKLITFIRYLLDCITKYLKRRRARVFAEKVFNNPYLVEKIVRNLDVKYYFATREVSKTFNQACLGVLRKGNRKMKIEFMQFVDEIWIAETLMVHINLIAIRISDAAFYFRFLNKVAGVKVEQIEVIDLWKITVKPSYAHLAKKFHEDIHSKLIGNNHVKSLIGLEDEPNNCSECVEIAKRCLEYGPVDQSWMLTNFGKHFEKIVVTDIFLDQFSNSLVSDTQSMEECYKILEDRLARPNISCTTLVLHIHEYRDIDNTGIHQDHTPIPWEVLEMALKRWKVQRIEIKFIRNWNDMPHLETWSASNYFTGIRFNDPVYNLDNFSFPQIINQVQVDLSRSVECGKELKLQHLRRGYENVVANIRRIFNTNQISINFTHWLFMEPSNPEQLLENLLRVSRIWCCRYLTINFKVYLKIENAIQLPEEFKDAGPLRPLYHNALNEKHIFKTVKWVGERYRFVDHRDKFTMNADVFVTEENYEKVMFKEQATDFMGMFQLDVFE